MRGVPGDGSVLRTDFTLRIQPEQRLRSSKDFALMRRAAFRKDCGFFIFVAHPYEGSSVSRIGVVASRRIGNAVRRNRAKRRLRALFRENAAEIPEPVTILLIARRQLLESSHSDITRRYRDCLLSLGQFLRRA